MKKALLSLLLIAGWFACFPAYATTYTYNVDYSFTTTPGQVTGSIVSSCDSCVLDGEQCPVVVIHGERWHERQFVRPDRRDKCFRSRCSKRRQPESRRLRTRPSEDFSRSAATYRTTDRTASARGAERRQYFSLVRRNRFRSRVSAGRRIRQRREFSRRSASRQGRSLFPSIEIASLAAAPEPPVWAMMISRLCAVAASPPFAGGGMRRNCESA